MKKNNEYELHKLFVELKNNDDKALEKIYIQYKNFIYRVAFSILKNSNDADDVVQNVICKIFKLDRNKLPSSKELSWLYTVTKNETFNFYKIKNKQSNLDDIYILNADDNSINRADYNIYFNQIIKDLNTIDQEILHLKIISDFSFKTISKILNMPISTVEWRYYKSIKYLRNSIILFVFSIVSVSELNKNYKISKTKELTLKENIAKKEEIDNKINNITNIDKNEYSDYEIDSTLIEKSEHYETIIEITNNELQELKNTNLIIISIFIIFMFLFIIEIIKYKRIKKNKV